MVAEHRRHRARQAASAAQVDVDVVGVRIGLAVPQRRRREQRGLLAQFARLAPAQLTGRQRAAAPLGLPRVVGRHAAQHVAEHPVADGPLLQGVDVDGDLVGDAVDVPRQRVLQRAEEALDRILEEPDQIGERDVLVRLARAAGRR